ncbi:MAG TPA: biotin transporter BioY [Bacteroidota bacterium]|jgi:biotin transport system substrate-specific component|nr:biotin transporter BioY [Bacteroidota bacterium]
MNQSQTVTASLEKEKSSLVSQALWIIGFSALTAIGAQIEIPHQPVPYTLQTFVVLLSGALLGKRNGALSQILYLAAGVSGLPVFSGFGFGLLKILGPTGGYLLSFPVAAYAVGLLIDQKKGLLRTIVGMAVGLLVIFSLGTLQLNYVVYHDWAASFTHGFLIFSWWDIAKLAGAVACYQSFSRIRS